MLGTACCFNQFLVKKRTKREISGRFSGKDPYNRTTIFPKRNGFFMIDTSFFFRFFYVKNRAKGEISDQFSGKTQYNGTSIFTKRNHFYARYSVLF